MNWSSVAAQCVMCFRTAAAQQAERSRVLNSGIIILLIPPVVVLAGILALAFWKNRAASQLELLMIPHDTPKPDLD